MHKKKIFVLGAGLAGLSAAWHLQRLGIPCSIFEKEQEAGGLCRSKNVGGFIFDYDGHLLHFKHPYVFNLVKKILKDNMIEHKRSAWIYSFNVTSRYPFQANLHGLPPAVAKECLVGFIEALKNNHKIMDKKKINFLQWINQTFGKGIANNFMVPYNTKFWTLPPRQMNCDWLDGFIPVPSLSQVVEGTLEDSLRQFGYNSRFWYPAKGGICQLAQKLSREIRNLNTGCAVKEIDLKNKEIKMSGGEKEKYDFLIFTLPLPEIPSLIKGLSPEDQRPFKKLRWNSIYNLNLGLEKKDASGRHWIYFPEKNTVFFRAGFFHNFSSSLVPEGKSSLYAEVSYSRSKMIDKNKIALSVKEDLIKVGLLNKGDRICCEDVNDIEYGYPIYDGNYRQARTEAIDYLMRHNIIPCGRYGSWRYLSMEEAIMDGKLAAELLS